MNPSQGTPATDEPVLRVEGLSKTFPGQKALADVSLEVRRGEVRALVGQNGSGKSTLIKILDGYHHPDPGGVVQVAGRPLQFGSHGAAGALGMRFIHQDLGLVYSLDVVDNLALGRGYRSGAAWISWRKEVEAAEATMRLIGADIDVTRRVGTLSQVERCMVAIARALDADGAINVLVLDEPTAFLPSAEVEKLFRAVRLVAERGAAVLYVSHRLDEIFELADRVTVLRDGRVVAHEDVTSLDHDRLVELIVGSSVDQLPAHDRAELPTETVLRVDGVCGDLASDVTFDVRRSEIVGITGLAGSGAFELAGLIFGSTSRRAGEVSIEGEPCPPASPAEAIARGMGYVPADRHANSIVPPFDLRENTTLPQIVARRVGGLLPWISTRREAREARTWLERLDVRPPEPSRAMATLSGGNQQKAVLARWFRCGPKVLVLDEPVQGVDVGAKRSIYDQITAAAEAGMAVVVCSSEIEDLAALCDRVLVMRDGRVAAELRGTQLTADRIAQESLASSGVAL